MMTLSRLERCFARCLRVLTRVFLTIFIFVLPERQRPNATKRVSSAKNPLLLLSGVQLARRIRRREVSCMEVVQAYISRIEAVNPLVNAVVKDRFASALQEADQVDKLVAEESEDEASLEEKFPLLGVPLSVKEAIALQGVVPNEGQFPNASGPQVDFLCTGPLCRYAEDLAPLLRIMAGPQAERLNLSEEVNLKQVKFYSMVHDGGSLFVSPVDRQLVDAECEIYTLSEILRVVPNEGQFPNASGPQVDFLCTGPLCRYAEDLAPLLRIMAGPQAERLNLSEEVNLKQVKFYSMVHDGGSLFVSPVDRQLVDAQYQLSVLCSEFPVLSVLGCLFVSLYYELSVLCSVLSELSVLSRLNLSEEVNLKQVKFYSMVHDGGSLFVSPVDRQLVDAQYQLIERLEADLGVRVQQVQIPEFKYAFQIWAAMMSSKNADGKAAQSFTGLMGDHGKPVWPLWELLKWILGLSYHTLPAIGLGLAEKLQSSKPSNDLLKKTQALRREMERLLGSDGVFLYPSHPKIAPKHHHPIFTPFNFIYTGIFNILGLPVTQCPLGLSTEGLPLGIQLVSNLYNDRLSIATARYVETAFGGWRDPGKA
ncbi:UNVERIFIED_CONTAM: hypothetical protein FKN15_031561 [Acipenser sinensis]